jgi:hypothetical protein
MATALEIDFSAFTQAAQQYGSRVWISRAVQCFLRDFMVETDWIEPSATADVSLYAAALGHHLAAGTLPVKQKTAEEIAADAEAARLAEARRNMGVVKYEDRPVRKLTDEAVQRDPIAEHNTATDAAFARKQNPELARREQRDQLAERMNPGQGIPGLVDESFSGNTVYTSGRVNHYKTQQAVDAAKQRNIQAKARFDEQQAAAAQAAANSRKGI